MSHSNSSINMNLSRECVVTCQVAVLSAAHLNIETCMIQNRPVQHKQRIMLSTNISQMLHQQQHGQLHQTVYLSSSQGFLLLANTTACSNIAHQQDPAVKQPDSYLNLYVPSWDLVLTGNCFMMMLLKLCTDVYGCLIAGMNQCSADACTCPSNGGEAVCACFSLTNGPAYHCDGSQPAGSMLQQGQPTHVISSLCACLASLSSCLM